jgi:hypothetical protein
MNKKICFIILMALIAMTARAYTYYSNVEIGNFKYNIGIASSSSEESYAWLQGLSSAGASATILDIKGYVTYNGTRIRVTRVSGFKNNTSITSVRIGYGVEEINYSAFEGCTALKYVTMPSSIKDIGNWAFQNCTALSILTYAGEVPPTLQYYTFDNSGTSKRVSTATYRGMNALKADANWVAAFGASNIKHQSGMYAYDIYSDNVYYVIKNGIPYRSPSSYTTNPSSCVIVAANLTSNTTVTINNNVSNTDNNAPGQYHVYGVADSAFLNNSAITQLKCNFNKADRIGENAFRNCTGLTSVEVTADTVGNFAFYGCSNLTSAALNKEGTGSVEYLGSYAFGKCGLTGTVNIPAITKYIGFAPFYSCSSLQKITVDANNTNYCDYYYALYNKAQTMLLQIPGNWQYSYSTLYFPQTLNRVVSYAAAGSCIASIFLPYNVKTIDNNAFLNCKSLYTVHLPSSLVTVGEEAFAGCDAIRVVYLNKDTPPYDDYFPEIYFRDKKNVDLYVPYEKSPLYQQDNHLWKYYNIKSGTYDHTNCYDIVAGGVCYTVTSEEGYSHNGLTGDGALKVVGIPAGTRTIPPTLNYGGRIYVPYIIGEYAAFNEGGEYTINQAQSIYLIQEAAFAGIKLTNFPFINVEKIRKYAFAQNEMNFDLDMTNFQYLEEIGYGAFEGSGITKFVSPISTSVDIGGFAFNDCQNLHEMFLYDASTGTSFIGNNASDFKCWINYRKIESYLVGGHYSTSVIRPYLRLDSEWQSFSCYKPINFEGTGVEAYIVTAYDKNQKKANLSNVAKLKEKNGAVVHGNVGSYYRLNYATGSNLTTSQYLKAVNYDELVQIGYNYDKYKLNATKPQFDKITETTFFNAGSSYLELSTSDTGGATTIYTNLSEGSGAVPGDVNGDGFVTAADVTALYDYMLNNDSSNIVNGDQDGDNHITAGDITTVYTIMLGN